MPQRAQKTIRQFFNPQLFFHKPWGWTGSPEKNLRGQLKLFLWARCPFVTQPKHQLQWGKIIHHLILSSTTIWLLNKGMPWLDDTSTLQKYTTVINIIIIITISLHHLHVVHRCSLLLQTSHIAWRSVCMCVRHMGELWKKWLNVSKCHLGRGRGWLMWVQGTMVQIPHGKRHFWGGTTVARITRWQCGLLPKHLDTCYLKWQVQCATS